MSPDAARDRVRLRDLLAGGWRTLPDLPGVVAGLTRLLMLRPDGRGSVGALIAEHARRRPQAPALRCDGRTWSYREFNAAANRAAAALRAGGVGPGDRVAVLMENRAEVLFLVAGILKLGAVAGMLNHQQRGQALSHSLRLTGASLLVVGEECAEACATLGDDALAADARRYWDGAANGPEGFDSWRAALDAASDAEPAETAAIRLGQPAFYIFTSGTTGLPKASVMTHFRWLRGMAGLSQSAVRLRSRDVFYCCLPLYHNNALTVSWGAVLGTGACLALAKKFSASRFWDEIRESGATGFCYIGELCRYLLKRPATPRDREHAVRVIVGNGLRPEIWDEFQQRFGIARIVEFYGASEANLAFVNAWGVARSAGYCPLSYAIVEFDADAEAPRRDAQNRLRRVPRGGVGLLIGEVTPKTPFDGYTDARATEAKLLRDVFKRGDAWFNTGDLVRDQGWHHIQFVDRVGDTFRFKGENVATTEVEAALGDCAGIDEVVVYGVQVPRLDGRAGMASLSLRAGHEFDGAALAAQLRARLPVYARPLFLRLRGAQDVTATFKHRKVDLKREAFDPALVAEPLYVLEGDRYVPLTPERHARIVAGDGAF